MLPKQVIYDGHERPPSEPIELHAGPVMMRLEPDGAFLRTIELVFGAYESAETGLPYRVGDSDGLRDGEHARKC